MKLHHLQALILVAVMVVMFVVSALGQLNPLGY